jgi:muconolactone delta-isomerase
VGHLYDPLVLLVCVALTAVTLFGIFALGPNGQRGVRLKVMAFGTLKPLTPEQLQKYTPTEVPDTLKLYLSGKIEQFWLREGMAGTIFLMNVDSVAEAKTLLGALPLTATNLLTFDLMQVGPLSPLGMLIH